MWANTQRDGRPAEYYYYYYYYRCAQLSYTTHHRIVVKIFPLILQIIIMAQTMPTAWSVGGNMPTSVSLEVER